MVMGMVTVTVMVMVMVMMMMIPAGSHGWALNRDSPDAAMFRAKFSL